MRTQKQVTAQVKLAKALGVSRQLVAYHARKKHAPSINDTEAWREFLLSEGRDASLPPELRRQLAKERLRLIREQADKLEDEKSVRRGETVEFAIVDRFIRDLVANCFFGELDRLANEFPVTLKGCNEVQIHTEIVAQVERIKKRLESKLATIGNSK